MQTYEQAPCMFRRPLDAPMEPLDSTFEVHVEGCTIHISFVFGANCCPDYMVPFFETHGDTLDFRVESDCFICCVCMCEFPITADLNVTASGRYLLRVPGHYSGWVDVTDCAP